MKKKKFLAVILIASSAFLGTGYSWWADELKVEGVVSTGNFKVTRVRTQLLQYTNTGKEQIQKSIVDSKDTEENKNLFCDMRDLIPGKTYLFVTEFKNEGSIPALIDCIAIEPHNIKDYEEMKKHIVVEGTVKVVGGDFENIPDLSINTTLEKLSEQLKELNDRKLEPGQSLVFDGIKVSISGEVTESAAGRSKFKKNKHQGKNIGFDLKIFFKQHNQL